MSDNPKKVHILLGDQEVDALAEVTEQLDISQAEMIRRAILLYRMLLDESDGTPPRVFVNDKIYVFV